MPADEAPRKKTYLETIMEMYPEEFHNKPKTLKQELRNMDQIIGIETQFLDNPDPDFTYDEEDEKKSYKDYRDNKRWLEDEG